jgi:transcriptional regulator GlxA family with amidase domain
MAGLPGTPLHIRSVGFVLIPGFALLSYAAAIEPLRAANHLAGKGLYRWWHAAPGNKPAIASNGTAILPDFATGTEPGATDLVLVCAGGNPASFSDRLTLSWLRKLAQRNIVLGGVSGGPFVLARAGLLDGRTCTVHWEHLPAMQEAFPNVKLNRTLFVLDRDRYTCSGGVAGLDMMTALIARDHGSVLGASVSDWLLHTDVREGDRPQRMDLRFRFGITNPNLLRALTTMETHLEAPLHCEHLARLAGISLRQLERAFRRELHCGVHQHYMSLRLARSRQLLRETSLSILEVALATGFSSASHFSRAFRRAFGFRPREERAAYENDHEFPRM